MKANAKPLIKKASEWLITKMGKKSTNETTNKMSVFFLELATQVLQAVPDDGKLDEIAKKLSNLQKELEVELDIKKYEDKNKDDK
jgi:hypothetical protein